MMDNRLDEIRQRAEQLVRIADNPYCLGPAALLDGVKEIVPALLSEVDRLNKAVKQDEAEHGLMLHSMEVDNGGALDMTIGGDAAKLFMCNLVRFFEQNGGQNFLTLSVEDAKNSYSITIQNNNGDATPAKKLKELTARAEAAEARADAAIEDLRQNGFCGSCSGCNAPHDPNNITWCYSWEWRGQEAGKEKDNVRNK